jgi:hypothetical protein
MLLASVPISFIVTTICPGVNTKSVLFVVLVLTLIDTPIIPDINTHALHVIFKPFAFVPTAI